MSLSNKAFTFIARIKQVQGEHEHFWQALVVASSEDSAWAVAQQGLAREYGDDCEVDAQGDVNACGGELFLAVRGIKSVGLSTFIEMHESWMPTYREDGLEIPSKDVLTTLKGVGTAVTQALQAQGSVVPHGHVLNALASVVGDRNWQQYKARQVPSKLLWQIIHHASEVNSYSDTTGCSDGYTVTYQPEIDELVNRTTELRGLLLDAKGTAQ